MIRSTDQLCSALETGLTVSKLARFDDPSTFAWVVTETGEPVHGTALKTAMKRERLREIGQDMFGHPAQYGAAQ